MQKEMSELDKIDHMKIGILCEMHSRIYHSISNENDARKIEFVLEIMEIIDGMIKEIFVY